MAAWTLKYGELAQTFEDWGLSGLQRTRTSLAADTCSFVADGAEFDSEEMFAYKALVRVFRDGVQWFCGRVKTIPRQGAQDENLSYSLEGPWWDLERCTLQQVWKTNGGASEVRLGRIILGQADDGSPLNTGGQITAVLNFAIAQGAYFQVGTIAPALALRFEELKDLTCAEAVRRLMRLHPDHVAAFDYSTEIPTLNILPRASLPAANLAYGTDEYTLSGIQITPRYDLQLPAVIINYERTINDNGTILIDPVVRIAPPDYAGSLLDVPVFTIPLRGWSRVTTKQKVKVRDIKDNDGSANTDATKKYWQTQIAALRDVDLADIELLDLEDKVMPTAPAGVKFLRRLEDPEELDEEGEPIEFEDSLGKELIEGAIAPWMPNTVKAQRQTITVRINVRREGAKVWTCPIMATNASSRTYRSSETTPGEDVPVGIETSLYAALSALQWSGSVTIAQEEATGLAGLGNVINIFGGRVAWETMNALVQSEEVDVDNGATNLMFGPPAQLGPQDMLELLRISKPGQSSQVQYGPGGDTSAEARTSGKANEGSTAELADKGPVRAPTTVDGSAAALDHGWKVDYRPDPGSPDAWQKRVTAESDVLKSLLATDVLTITGLGVWTSLNETDLIWLEITVSGYSATAAAIKSLGNGDSGYDPEAFSWTSGGYVEAADNGDPLSPQNILRVPIATSELVATVPVIHQAALLHFLLEIRPVAGRPALVAVPAPYRALPT